VKRIVFLCLVLCLNIFDDQSSGAGPSKGLNRLGSAVGSQIDRVFARFDRRDCPGCALGIWKQGKIVYTHGYGISNLENPSPITPESVFEAGSVSKQFTAAAILLLAKQGRLSLDDDVRKFLPEVPPFGKQISIRHLLTHTSGLRDQWELLTLAGRPPGTTVHTLDEILYLVSRQKELNFDPGEEYLYSNTGYSLLACIVKRVTGRSLAEWSQTEIFGPLGMDHSQWRDDFSRIVPGRTTAYRMDQGRTFHSEMPFTNVYGNGGLLTTVGDLILWNESFFRPRILTQSLIDQMQTPTRLNDGRTVDYGLGVAMGEFKGVKVISHSGSTAGYRAFLVRFPDQQLSIAILCNLANADPGSLAQRVAEILLSGSLRDPAQAKAVEMSQEDLARMVGLYRNMGTDEVLSLQLVSGRLFLREGGRRLELIPAGEARFTLPDGKNQIIFESGDKEKPSTLSVTDNRSRPTTYVSVPLAVPSLHDLDEYRGDYYSGELDVVYSARQDSGKLTVRHRPEPPILLEPAFADAFSDARGRVFRFTRDDAGRVNGFRVFAGRVRHLLFVRRD
jgi:CubicO group peptidase (beta-lactamase class C family)